MYLSFDWEVTWKVNCYFGRRMCAKVWKIRLFSEKNKTKSIDIKIPADAWLNLPLHLIGEFALSFYHFCSETFGVQCAVRRTLDCFSPESQFIRCILFVLNAHTCADSCVQWINYNRMTPLMRFISQQFFLSRYVACFNKSNDLPTAN